MLDFGPALQGLGQAVEQQRQRKLQQALQALQIRKMMGQPITAAEWQPIAQQIEQQSKALGTPFQLPRQAQMGPAQTQVTPSGGPSFGAGTAQIPPQPTGKTEYAPPRQPIGEMSVKDLVKDPQRLGELAKQFPGIDQATVEEANQNYPEWRFYLRGGQSGMGGTFGDYFPRLKDTPQGTQLAQTPVPFAMFDMKTGQIDYAKAEAYIRAQGLQPATPHETNIEQQQKINAFNTAVRAAETRIGQYEQDILRGKPGQIHAAVAARDQYLNSEQQRLKRAADALRAQGVPVEFSTLSYTRYTPEQLAGITRPAREQEARQEARDARSEALLRLAQARDDRAKRREAGGGISYSSPETIDGHQLRIASKAGAKPWPEEFMGGHWRPISETRYETITGTPTADITRRRALSRHIAALNEQMQKPGANKTKLRQQLAAAEAELKQLGAGGQPKPADSATGQAPSPRATEIVRRYKAKPEPMPASQFNQLTPEEQTWLRNQIVIDNDK